MSRQLANVQVEGIDWRDAPDWVDAYIAYAEWEDTGEPLTEAELDAIDSDTVYEYVISKIY